jgi:hypothetical protein
MILKKHFFFNGYKMFHNSKTSNRGVGILVSKNLINDGFTVHDRLDPDDGNSLFLSV